MNQRLCQNCKFAQTERKDKNGKIHCKYIKKFVDPISFCRKHTFNYSDGEKKLFDELSKELSHES